MRCPNCNYTLVLLPKRAKYKCPKCSRLYTQKEIELKDFVDFNKRERKNDKEALTEKSGKQKPLTDFEKKQNKLACQRRWRENNRTEYNRKKRVYWEMNKINLLEKRKENYNRRKAEVKEQQRLYRLRNVTLRRINHLRTEQKLLAQHFFEFEYIKPYNADFREGFPTLALS